MVLGRPVLHWLIVIVVFVCVFFVAQWLIPLLAGLIDFSIPSNIVNILSFLIALSFGYGGYSYRRGSPVA